ncbi:QWRF motif-containing protein 3 [Euphorbia lathyris]|uniref:QWRF motif-containing protein 3 n=1 Tax=Euphorbia lathyris TaxID=212925 RepID=UPI003313B342
MKDSALLSDKSVKPKKPKSREVSSRFLSSTPTATSPTPSQVSSPARHERKHRSLEDPGFIRGLWPSTTSPSPNNNNVDTLADHLGNERLRDFIEKKKDEKSSKNIGLFSLTRQRSCSEHNRFENEKEKENHRPILGGSLRYTGKLISSSSSSSSSNFVPGRLSVDENVLYQRRKSEHLDEESESFSENSRKSGVVVSSKYLQDVQTKCRRSASDSNIEHPVSLDSSPKMKKSRIKSVIKRANSLAGYGSATSQWALSPGRSGSPPMSLESKERVMSFSSLKPPSSPSRVKGMEKLLNLGRDLLKGKKSSSARPLVAVSGGGDATYQLRLLHNRMMQWRYVNVRASVVDENIAKDVEKNLLSASDNLANLRRSVLIKRLQLQKEKFEMKLDFILHSQIKQLEAWGDMERQHLSAVLKTKECLHSVVCKVPLIEGAKVDPQQTWMAFRHAIDLTASINSAMSICNQTEENADLISQLAEVVSQEKLLLEEGQELLQTISTLEIEERSFKCSMIQLNQLLQQHQHVHNAETLI